MTNLVVTTRDLQTVLARLKTYKGSIDNLYGTQTDSAVYATITLYVADADRIAVLTMPPERMRIAALQVALNTLGHEAGEVDGFFGYNTHEALISFYHEHLKFEQEALSGRAGEAQPELPNGSEWPHETDVEAFYGSVGTDQVRCKLAYPMRLAWDQNTVITSFSCHSRVQDSMEEIFALTLDEYGVKGVRDLRLDIFGGCLNVRKMRGGNRMSMHSWGIAVDLDPAHNQLRWGSERASLARSEYKPFWNIVEKMGAVSLGRVRNYDWMHFQFAQL